MKNYHLAKKGDEWKLTPEGGKKSVVSAETKAEAIDQTRAYMQTHPGSVKIHLETGPVQEERTYPRSEDPKKSKG